jgi:DNA repair protein RadC
MQEIEKDTKAFQVGHKSRIQARYMNESLENFHAHEILELILSITIVRKDTKVLAKTLLNTFGGLNSVMNASAEDLQEIPGVGLKTATTIKLFKDVNVYLMREKMNRIHVFKSVESVHNYLILKYRGVKNEEFRVLYVNSKNILLKDGLISKGISTKTLIDFRLIAKEIFNISATGIIVVHNHPSGDCKPSNQDISTTNNLKSFLNHLNVRLLDHFIVGYDEIFSFAEEGLL